MLQHATKAERTRNALLEATERCLSAGGYPAATSTAVAAAAGVSVGTFYSYFSDRDAALATLLAHRLAALREAVTAQLTTDALLDDGLDHVMGRAIAVVLDHYRAHAATFRAALTQLPSSPAIRAAYWAAHRDAEAALTAFIRRAQAAGKIRVADPTVLAQTVLVLVQATNHPLLLARPRAQRTRAVTSELVGALVGVLAPAS